MAAAGYKWRSDHFHDQVANMKPGDAVEVAVLREGRLRLLQVPLVELPKDKFTVTLRKGDATATRLRKAWLGEGKAKPKGRKPRRLKPKARETKDPRRRSA